MELTGVKATPEELQDLVNLASQGWQPGDIVLVSSVMQGITKDQKTLEARQVCHQLAMEHGLPEVEGYYGITAEGEFVYP